MICLLLSCAGSCQPAISWPPHPEKRFRGLGKMAKKKEGSWIVRYGAGALAVGAAFALRLALTSLIGRTELAFSIFMPAILFSAWFGGFGLGLSQRYFLRWPLTITSLRRWEDPCG